MPTEDGKSVIGVLALQGCVKPHQPHIEACNAEYREVRLKTDFQDLDGLILPGGESTTMLKLIKRYDLKQTLVDFAKTKPVWGICAGVILMADQVTDPDQESFNLLGVHVKRNGYGRQLDSRHSSIEGYQVSYIRAPLMTAVNDDVNVVASDAGDPVWVEQGHIMGTTFHPELTLHFPSPMHQSFTDKCTS